MPAGDFSNDAEFRTEVDALLRVLIDQIDEIESDEARFRVFEAVAG